MQEFKPITRATISSKIVEQVLSMIRSKGFKPGDKLPTERELSEAFQVGRSSVREAMKILEATGLIETTNRGKCINEAESGPTNTLETASTNVHEVFEARKVTEVEMAALAAQRATPKDLKNIEAKLPLMLESKERHEAYAADISFHKAVVNSAHNSVFSEIYNMISGLLFQHLKYYSILETVHEDLSSYVNQITPDHEKIFEAIKARDSAAARLAVDEHLYHAETKLLFALGQKRKDSHRVRSQRTT